ncbi:MAG: hypothetical protein KC466_19645, partial [Myxococcales bacterium]|nr:hypothetical protein [Myxococcales bacterium]
MLAEPLCRRAECEPGTCENEHTVACLDEYTLCREPFPMTDLVSYDSGTQTGKIRTNISLSSDKRVEVPSPFQESEVIYFIEVFGTYDLGGTTHHFFYTSLPMTPPNSPRQLDASLAYGTDADDLWFRPRLRAHGGVGPASGDTCCSYPGEVVLVDSESISSEDRDQCPNYPGVSEQSFVLELAVPTGDGIGDACYDFGDLGASAPYSLQDIARLRGSAWAGRGDVAGDPQTTVAFFYRRGAQLADNDRDGIGNYCESGWNYDSTSPVVFNDGLDDTDQPDPGGHGVPGGLLPAVPPCWFANCFDPPPSGCEARS